jgi:hypothetical protein
MDRRNGPLAVLALLALACSAPESTSNEELQVNAKVQACPTVSTLTAIDSKASTRAPGNTSTIYASAAAPNPHALRYTFSVTSGRGTLSDQKTASNAAGTSSSVIFTCAATQEIDTVRLVTTDQTGAICPASPATASITVTCDAP